MIATHLMSEKRSDEESRCWQAAPVNSKNEMLHFVQHDIVLHAFIQSPFHDSLEKKFLVERLSLICHYEEPARVTWQSPRKKEEIASPSARNDIQGWTSSPRDGICFIMDESSRPTT
jgi:hypothetical protein